MSLSCQQTNNAFSFVRANINDNWTDPEFFAALDRAYIPESKTAVIYEKMIYKFIREELNRTDPPKLLKERFLLESSAIQFPHHHFLYEIFDRKLQQYIEANLIDYNNRYFDEINNPKRYETYSEPFAVLTFAELEAGFSICLMPLVLSIFLFVAEWMPALKDLMIFLVIFKKYFEVKNLEQSNHSKIIEIKFTAWQAMFREKIQNGHERDEVTALPFVQSDLVIIDF